MKAIFIQAWFANRATGQYLEAIDKLDERGESIGVSAPGIS
jgi:hypothetical protein